MEGLRRQASDNVICIYCGNFGSSSFDNMRKGLFGLSLVASVFTVVFTCAALFPAASLDPDTLRDVPWLVGVSDGQGIVPDYEWYFGLSGYSWTEYGATTGDEIQEFTQDYDVATTAKQVDFPNKCEWECECAQAGIDVLGTLCVSFIFQILTAILLGVRGFGSDDNAAKTSAVLITIFGFLCILGGLAQFSDECYDAIPISGVMNDDFADGMPGFEVSYSHGFSLMATVMIAYFPMLLIHLLTRAAIDPEVANAELELKEAAKKKKEQEAREQKALDTDLEVGEPVEAKSAADEGGDVDPEPTASGGITLHLDDDDIEG